MCRVVAEYREKRGITIGSVNVFRVTRADGAALEEGAAFAPSKLKLTTIYALDPAPFAGGAHLLLLERKPGECLAAAREPREGLRSPASLRSSPRA